MKKTRIASSQLLRIFSQRVFPIVAWIGAAFWIQSHWSDQQSLIQFRGQVMTEPWEISGTSAGLLTEMRTELFAEVRPGQVLAVLDDAPLLAELQVARKEVDRLAGEVEAARSALAMTASEEQADWMSDFRRFQVDQQRFRVQALDLELQVTEVQADLQRQRGTVLASSARAELLEERAALAENEWQRQEKLLRRGVVAVNAMEDARAEWLGFVDEKMLALQQESIAQGQIQSLQASLAALENSAQTNEEQIHLADTRLLQFQKFQLDSFPEAEDPRLSALQLAIQVQSSRVDRLVVQHRALKLRAEMGGIVTGILALPGQSILPGEPVLMLAKADSSRILGWIPSQLAARDLAQVSVFALSSHSGLIPVSFLKAGPVFEEIPRVLWSNPALPEYGRPVLLALPAGANLIPGEPIQLSARL